MLHAFDFCNLYDRLVCSNNNIWSIEDIKGQSQNIRNVDDVLKLLSDYGASQLKLSYALEYDYSVISGTTRIYNSDGRTLSVSTRYDNNLSLLSSFCPLRSPYSYLRSGYRWYSQPIPDVFLDCYNSLYSLLNKVYMKEIIVHIYMKNGIPVVDLFSASDASVGFVESIKYGSSKKLDFVLEKAITHADKYKQVVGEFYFLLRKNNGNVRMHARENIDREYIISFF